MRENSTTLSDNVDFRVLRRRLMVLPQHSPVRFAGISELDDMLATGGIPSSPWPPPGTHIEWVGPATVDDPIVGGALRLEVVADEDYLPADGFWWTTLGQLLLDRADWPDEFGPALLALYLTIRPDWAGGVAAIPVFYRGGEGVLMRWIKTTYRGTLGGGVEQFQFSINFGNPGADPTLAEADALPLAEQLAAIFKTVVNHPTAGMMILCAPDVMFTEVGVTQLTQTDATGADGSGGNLEQSYETAWANYPATTEPVGLSGIVTLPYEVACAVTLQTDKRGPSGRGRVYLPPFSSAQMVAGGLFTSAGSALGGTVIGDYFDAVVAATPYVPIVVSRRRIVLNEVTSINVGRVPDSQRRRRRSQDEARVTVWP